jgi:hypothetical protein
MMSVVFLAGSCGCYSYHSMKVLVKDGETGQPIPDAVIHVATCQKFRPLIYPYPIREDARTDQNGIAVLQVTPYYRSALETTARSPGYLRIWTLLKNDEIERFPPADSDPSGSRPIDRIITLFQEPEPTVELVLPSGFRGPVAVKIVTKDDVFVQPGERRFSYKVPPGGGVVIEGPRLLDYRWTRYEARYADGPVLKGEEFDDVRLHFIGVWSSKLRLFMVGTDRDREELQHSLRQFPYGDEDRHAWTEDEAAWNRLIARLLSQTNEIK